MEEGKGKMEKVEETSGQLELWALREEPSGAVCHPERSEGAEDRYGPLRSAQGDKPTVTRRPASTLQRALDRIHTRYGVRGVTRGIQLVALTARAEP